MKRSCIVVGSGSLRCTSHLHLRRRNLDGRKRTAGPALVVLISQDISAFRFPPTANLLMPSSFNRVGRTIQPSLQKFGGLSGWRVEQDLQSRAVNRGDSSLDDLIPQRISYQFTHRVNVQLAHDVGSVRLRSLDADLEGRSHLFATLALREQLQNLEFAGS